LVIDGYTQAGASPNTLDKGTNAELKIEIRGDLIQPQRNSIGLSIEARSVTVRGLALNGFDTDIVVQFHEGNRILGCFIGVDAEGVPPSTMRQFGTGLLFNASSNNRVGGPLLEDRNLIAGHPIYGVAILGRSSNGNVLQGNIFGTDKSGELSVFASRVAVYVFDARNTLVGGASQGEGNTIAGSGIGVEVTGEANFATLIQGNRFGSEVPGNRDLQNFRGILLLGSIGTVIGGPDGAGNIIANQNSVGITVIDAPTKSSRANRILANSIHSNGRGGIDLGDDGVSPNDALDADLGPNKLQNFPELSSAVLESAGIRVGGELLSEPNRTFRVHFYANRVCASSGFGEGERFLGELELVTDAQGIASLDASLPKTALNGEFITATATGPGGDTSEFSACEPITG